MPFIPHTDTDVRDMLATIGVPSIDALFDEIPASLRGAALAGVPEALAEMEKLPGLIDQARESRVRNRPACGQFGASGFGQGDRAGAALAGRCPPRAIVSSIFWASSSLVST